MDEKSCIYTTDADLEKNARIAMERAKSPDAKWYTTDEVSDMMDKLFAELEASSSKDDA